MRIAVVGLGGVGGYIAANLSKTSHEVVGFARGEHLEKIKQNGLKIIEDQKTWTQKIDAKSIQEAEGYFDIVVFCVKSYDLKDSFDAISTHLYPETILFSLANGVEHGEELRILSNCKVLDACVYILSHVEDAGVIRKKGKVFATVVGGLNAETNLVKDIFDECGLRCKVDEDIMTAIWKKYIFISAFASATSYYDKSIVYVYEHYFDEVKSLLEEIAKVAHAKGITIDDEVEKSLNIAKNLPPDSSTSMHLDFQNKKKDELNTLSGYIVKEAKRVALKVPIMQKMYEKLLEKHVD